MQKIYPSKTPRLTIITPSFNQAEFLERTIDSVLSQGHPNLEYFVIDGGSNDGSIDIIRRYERYLTWWTSEPDRGQVDAINKGLLRSTGEWVGWQNSDDIYLPGALAEAAQHMAVCGAEGVIAGSLVLIDGNDQPIRELRYVTPTFRSLKAEGMVIANQSTWWRRSLHGTVGLLDERYDCSFDYDWFLRLLKQSTALYIDKPLGALRLHGQTKTSNLASRFTQQNSQILSGWGAPSPLERKIFQIRRTLFMIKYGHIGYVLRGIYNRLLKSK